MKEVDRPTIKDRLLHLRSHSKPLRTPRAKRRWRVEVINENTLVRVWSSRVSGIWAPVTLAAVVAAIVSLVVVILAFTPVGRILPGRLSSDARSQYMDAALKIDSLEHLVSDMSIYTSNIAALLSDSVPSFVVGDPATPAQAMSVDSLIEASDAERQFVQRFDDEQRFNLSVLAPIAAEGMIFEAPVESASGAGPVSAIYRGTVVSVYTDADGISSVTIQHPNDFLSVYSSLSEVYVSTGTKVLAAQRIGAAKADNPLLLDFWHNGVRLDPADYVPQK